MENNLVYPGEQTASVLTTHPAPAPAPAPVPAPAPAPAPAPDGDRTYGCMLCGLSFKARGLMVHVGHAHFNQHTFRYTCGYCGDFSVQATDWHASAKFEAYKKVVEHSFEDHFGLDPDSYNMTATIPFYALKTDKA